MTKCYSDLLTGNNNLEIETHNFDYFTDPTDLVEI